MVALRLFTLLLLAASVALPASADVFPYEADGIAGRNNLVDSNAISCDTTGTPAVPGQGCYTRTGGLCSANPGKMCDLQIIPAGRCTSGDLSGGLVSCVWPHGAGRCASNTKVGCLTDAYILNPANVAAGPSVMCSALGTNTCNMTNDPFGGTFRTSCACQGTDPAAVVAPLFETTVCGGGAPVCSDGDVDRDVGGFGTALGVHLITGAPGSQTYAAMGPSTTGSGQSTSTPYYTIENPPSVFDAQRDAGTVGRTNTGVIHEARTTDAREITNFLPALGVRKIQAYGDSYWNDWAFATVQTTGTFNTHIVVFSCDPPVGWSTDDKIDPGTPANPADDAYCSQLGRDGVLFVWSRDLTLAEQAANPTCPPTCKKDFDVSTTELAAFVAAGALDPDAGAQLAIQSGEGRTAGAGDSIGVAVVTSITWLVDGDLRCRLGGWGNVGGEIGRCVDGPLVCNPGAGGDALCAAALQTGFPGGANSGGSCRACNGPLPPTPGANATGLPIGYNTRGRPELDLVIQQRIGGIAGQDGDVRVPLFVVGTSGNAAADFRDLPTEGGNTFDLAELGRVVNPALGGAPWATGVGAGGSFTNPSTLPIGEACCANGANIVWAAAQLGDPFAPGSFPAGNFGRTYDIGPGPDGIPGCIGDNAQAGNGALACDTRLGVGGSGPKSNGYYATGKDDVLINYEIATGTFVPASTSRFKARDADAATVTYFSTTYGTTSNPPTVNSQAAFTDRDITVFAPNNTDILVKVNTTQCPIIGGSPACSKVVDTDGDTIPDATDNCPTVANTDQSDTDADLVGQLCDNCTGVANPRVTAAFLGLNPWVTMTGGQRDDDHDGIGTRCDAKFVGAATSVVGALDLNQYRASAGKSRDTDLCGTIGTRPCAIFDLDENTSTANTIGALDLNRFRALSGFTPGPRCALCTGTGSAQLPCTSGPNGSCSP